MNGRNNRNLPERVKAGYPCRLIAVSPPGSKGDSMLIMLSKADFIRLFRIDDSMAWKPGLQVLADGVYAAELGSETKTVAKHRGKLIEDTPETLAEPILRFPFELDDLEPFLIEFDLSNDIDRSCLTRLIKAKALTSAIANVSEEQTYSWPIVSGVFDIRDWVKRTIEIESGKLNRDSSTIVAMREVEEKLNSLLSGQAPLNKEQAAQVTRTEQWPWGKHETKLLQHLAAAAGHWWANYDPTDSTTAPTNESVSLWLKDRGVSMRAAEIMAMILRADGVPPGPRT